MSTSFYSASIEVTDFWGVKLSDATLEVRVNREQYDKAYNEGEVKGKIVNPRSEFPYVLIELGKKTNYKARSKDDPNTDFKRFVKCHVWATDTEEKLNDELFFKDAEGITVIIYC